MVNYLYDLDDIEKNHEAYVKDREVIASHAVTRLIRQKSRELLGVARLKCEYGDFERERDTGRKPLDEK